MSRQREARTDCVAGRGSLYFLAVCLGGCCDRAAAPRPQGSGRAVNNTRRGGQPASLRLISHPTGRRLAGAGLSVGGEMHRTRRVRLRLGRFSLFPFPWGTRRGGVEAGRESHIQFWGRGRGRQWHWHCSSLALLFTSLLIAVRVGSARIAASLLGISRFSGTHSKHRRGRCHVTPGMYIRMVGHSPFATAHTLMLHVSCAHAFYHTYLCVSRLLNRGTCILYYILGHVLSYIFPLLAFPVCLSRD